MLLHCLRICWPAVRARSSRSCVCPTEHALNSVEYMCPDRCAPSCKKQSMSQTKSTPPDVLHTESIYHQTQTFKMTQVILEVHRKHGKKSCCHHTEILAFGLLYEDDSRSSHLSPPARRQPHAPRNGARRASAELRMSYRWLRCVCDTPRRQQKRRRRLTVGPGQRSRWPW